MCNYKLIIIKYLKVIIGIFIVGMGTPPLANGQSTRLPATDAKTSQIWKAIAPHFSPPEKYEGQYGSYRSPLKFYNGDSVKTKQDWQKRRKEIRSRWMHMMGEWPPLLKDQNMEIADTTHKDGYTQYSVSFLWTPKSRTEGYMLVPDGEEKKPAVITVYYDPETAIGKGKLQNRDFALQLAKRGFVTLSLGTSSTASFYLNNYALFYPNIDNVKVEPLSMLGYMAANAWEVLSKVPQVDSTRIGIMGHSYGGKWAMFASTLFNKFTAAVWSDPSIVFDETEPMANYWEPDYLGFYPPPWRKPGMLTVENPATGTYAELRAEGYDLHELHALMAPRPFLVSGGAVDRPESWIVLNHARAVNRLLGYENRVAMTNRKKHSPNPMSNQEAYLFFEYFLNRKGSLLDPHE